MLALERNCAKARATGTVASIVEATRRLASSSNAAASPACARLASARTSSTRSRTATLACAQHFAQQLTEQTDVVAQRLVRILGHRLDKRYTLRMCLFNAALDRMARTTRWL